MHPETKRSHLRTQPDTEEVDVADFESERPRAYNRLEDLRRDAAMSRKEVAEALQISSAVLANIERGQTEPGVMLAWTFASYFGLPLEKVFSDEPLPTLTDLLKGSCSCNAHAEGSC